ncbi:Putative 2-aminoethylphosphonate-binding periplasmic protein precursor [Arthrobacter saudimassiliensis]|uniref:Putative 2-aminoethylphosphonate-binding periplasmic protein n=1 Tax=Arthrobacter saudimassiliensis TaxID=1461584 RepID=A0A078MW89_9MICC|nr:Putative 2-aminoethylphosphonate-binding periplasmic protein precursor [Arthrobacter saudimassiliensis]
MLHRYKYPALALAAVALLTACGGGADGADSASDASPSGTSAGAGGSLTVYTSEPQAKIDELVAAYNEVNPDVSVEVFRAGTGELKTRIATEKETGGIQADVILAADVPTFEAYAAEGDLQVLDIDNTGELNPYVVDAEGYYVGTRIIPTVIAYNTTLVDSAPESWADLVDEQYKGMIAMPNPDVSGAAAFNTAVWLETPALGETWLTDLVNNDPTVLESNGPVGQAVAAGTSGIGIVVDYVARELADKGSPVSLAYPTDGVPYVSQPAGVFTDAKNPEAAHEFVEFLVSKEGQELAVAQSYLPVRDDAGVPAGAPALAGLELLNPDLAAIAEKQASSVAKFNELLK